jgi:hypothetical protein
MVKEAFQLPMKLLMCCVSEKNEAALPLSAGFATSAD